MSSNLRLAESLKYMTYCRLLSNKYIWKQFEGKERSYISTVGITFYIHPLLSCCYAVNVHINIVVCFYLPTTFSLQASPSSSSLSSTHSAPSQMMNSAPSTIRGKQLRFITATRKHILSGSHMRHTNISCHWVPHTFSDTCTRQYFFSGKLCLLSPPAVGSPSLPDKYRHNREMLMLLPPHRERPSSAMYTNITENGQVYIYIQSSWTGSNLMTLLSFQVLNLYLFVSEA